MICLISHTFTQLCCGSSSNCSQIAAAAALSALTVRRTSTGCWLLGTRRRLHDRVPLVPPQGLLFLFLLCYVLHYDKGKTKLDDIFSEMKLKNEMKLEIPKNP